jgi:MauM/NapG family ferredoxin protein
MAAQKTKSRRSFLKSTTSLLARASLCAGAIGTFLLTRGGRSAPPEARGPLGIVRPPGALPESEFLARCIRCTRCADACEPQCIRFFGPEAGELQGTPCIVPETKACNLCLRCGPACPTGAITPLEKKEDAKMGLASVDKRLCVSHAGTGACGACHTICPLRNRALTQGIRSKPEIHDAHCTGCGMCEEICIVRDNVAIRVQTERLWAPRPAPEE